MGRSWSVCVARKSLFLPSHQATARPSFASQPSIHPSAYTSSPRPGSSRVEARRHIVSAKLRGLRNTQSASRQPTSNPTLCTPSLPVTSKRATICRVSSVVQSSVQIFLPRILCPVPRARSLQRMHACTHARTHAAPECLSFPGLQFPTCCSVLWPTS